MKALLCMTSIALLLILGTLQDHNEANSEFDIWALTHGKTYATIERQYRANVYRENKFLIESHNSDSTQSYKMGENQFMDITKEEYQSLYIISGMEQRREQTTKNLKIKQFAKTGRTVPDSVDWRGKATIRNQGNCLAGGPICAASSVDAYYAINNKQKIVSSPQHILDCNGDENPCDNPKPFFLSMAQVMSSGVTAESKYPYVGKKQTCKITEGEYTVNDLIYLVEDDVDAMQEALVTGPVLVSLDGSKWQFYKEGIFSNCDIKKNHWALVMGYDREDNWFVQNSFGTGWGEDGFIRLAPGNTCGVLQDGWQFL